MDATPIDYSLVSKALEFYVSKGYEYIDVPWMINPKFGKMTESPDSGIFTTIDSYGRELHLIGSGELGFIQMAHLMIPNKKYVSATPCFRRGDISVIHSETFFKVELSSCSNSSNEMYLEFINDAMILFKQFGADSNRLNITYPDKNDYRFNHDIEYPVSLYGQRPFMLELGSYGQRYIENLHSTNNVINYGTGLALPRFQLIEKT